MYTIIISKRLYDIYFVSDMSAKETSVFKWKAKCLDSQMGFSFILNSFNRRLFFNCFSLVKQTINVYIPNIFKIIKHPNKALLYVKYSYSYDVETERGNVIETIINEGEENPVTFFAIHFIKYYLCNTKKIRVLIQEANGQIREKIFQINKK